MSAELRLPPVAGDEAAVCHAALGELIEMVGIPNDVDDPKAIRANATALRRLFERRGFRVRLLESEGGRPALFAELGDTAEVDAPTILVYCHYDGVPPRTGWNSDPYRPVLRCSPDGGGLGQPVPWPTDGRIDPGWRLYGRSAADSKHAIAALLSAVDLIHQRGDAPGVHLKVLLDGEEERESPGLAGILEAHRALLRADIVLSASGEVHPSGQPTVVAGFRGILLLELTAFTSESPAHSGHFAGTVPNAATELARMLSSLKSPDGNVRIPGFYDQVRALSDYEATLVDAMPAIDAALQQRFAYHQPEVANERWHDLLNRPTLNVRGMVAGTVGPGAGNVVPHRATAELDLRLVADMDPDQTERALVTHLRRDGATVLDHEPSRAELIELPHIAVVKRLAAFPAVRTSVQDRATQQILELVRRSTGGDVVVEPTEGGSLPLHLFLTVADAVLGIPTSNYDNNQHGPDENLRIGNLFDAINRWATILGWQLGDTRRSDGPLEVGIEADVITRVHRTPRTCSGANSSGCS